MDVQAVSTQLTEIQSQLNFITAELEASRRQRQEIQELKTDLNVIVKDLFQTAVTELEEVAPFVDTGDFLYLLKKIIRNTRNITVLITKLENVFDLMKDGGPIGKELFNDLLRELDTLDQKGYFDFIRASKQIMDNIVTHFTVEDVRLLGDNIVTILDTVKNLTQPEMLQAINNAASIYKNLDPQESESYSLWRVFKELNTPEMKRGIGFMVMFLKNIAAENGTLNTQPITKGEE
ncbi:MAG: DUF1641 domain-containing protein [FCB group bacterium]|nr:DUF1641 domain-containing protein [FCB group bacterium]